MPLLSTEDVGGMELEGAGGGGDDGGDYEDDEGAFLDGDFIMGDLRTVSSCAHGAPTRAAAQAKANALYPYANFRRAA
jgi:hypothetical protein